MKAAVADTLESLESYRLKDVDMPAAGPGQVLIRVAACGVGYVDSLVALGRYQVKPPVPHTPGQEVAGTVEAVGEGVAHLAPGDRVMTMTGKGFADYAVAAAPMVVKLPDALSFAEGASLPLNYITAMHALKDRGVVAEGETVLVFGAAGGVGSAAIQVGKALGARVIAAASTEEKRAFALAHGADLAIDTSPEGWRDRLKTLTEGKGPNVILDPVCGPLFEPAFRSLAWRGRHLVVGFVGGPIPALPSNLTLMKGAALLGVDVRQYLQYETKRAIGDLHQLAQWASEGKIKPPVGRVYPFAEFGEAMVFALSGQGTGKVVLKIAGD
ncbi:putative quinone oxidoreductase [Hyphomonas polymorpha PS728]|uniref:Putative quinone oxidoreductase n=1 Tax=Hyphomonas polymorpha PS728 TaxID=1280954 RepID=A0A062VMW3_9PROT|nr:MULTISPECIES: NADPH:quinone oxidoreductase family protein [Hyphomonas]AXE64606.1 quinone oxidoreductase [Hyphomonas sp. CACIAM 19H1]KDA00022.1 putative quinone oxidoreductase [Hyphomonas polymorpha PS728]